VPNAENIPEDIASEEEIIEEEGDGDVEVALYDLAEIIYDSNYGEGSWDALPPREKKSFAEDQVDSEEPSGDFQEGKPPPGDRKVKVSPENLEEATGKTAADLTRERARKRKMKDWAKRETRKGIKEVETGLLKAGAGKGKRPGLMDIRKGGLKKGATTLAGERRPIESFRAPMLKGMIEDLGESEAARPVSPRKTRAGAAVPVGMPSKDIVRVKGAQGSTMEDTLQKLRSISNSRFNVRPRIRKNTYNGTLNKLRRTMRYG